MKDEYKCKVKGGVDCNVEAEIGFEAVIDQCCF